MKSLSRVSGYGGSFVLAGVVFAQEQVELKPPGVFAGLEEITLPSIVPVIIQVILVIAALVALVFLIIGGIKWITAGGDKAATESARGTITSAVVGLAIILAAWAIIRLIELFFGIKILSLEIPAFPRTTY